MTSRSPISRKETSPDGDDLCPSPVPAGAPEEIGIPHEEVTEILEGLDAAEVRVEQNRRRSVRQFQLGAAVISGVFQPGKLPTEMRVPLRNASAHGFAFLWRAPLEPGTRFRAELPPDLDFPGLNTDVTVTRCRQIKENVFEIGAEYY